VPKNILIFSDGTGQAGGLRPDQTLSNVYKLYRSTRVGPENAINPERQLAFYDAGLGTSEHSDPLWVRPITTFRKFLASATGSGISQNIADCYEAILERYQPGDRIYLFGFSRGGYTVRCLANVIRLCGIPTHGKNDTSLPRKGPMLRAIVEEAVFKVYDHATGRNANTYEAERDILAARFRKDYGSSNGNESNVFPYFIGVFDAVASIGLKSVAQIILLILGLTSILGISWGVGSWVSASLCISYWLSIFVIGTVLVGVSVFKLGKAYIKTFVDDGRKFSWHLSLPRFSTKDDDSYLDPRIPYARHAMSIDERRAAFPRAKWGGAYSPEETLDGVERFVQLWFAGNHSDIGGSYPEDESRLSDIPLKWMIDVATSIPHPIKIDKTKLHLFPRADGMQHCEVEARKMAHRKWIPKFLRFDWPIDIRWSASGAPHHASVAQRFELPAIQNVARMEQYRPSALIFQRGMAIQCQEANPGCRPEDFEERWKLIQESWLTEDC
jgi:uncharacterized protein (DUF2235 family)